MRKLPKTSGSTSYAVIVSALENARTWLLQRMLYFFSYATFRPKFVPAATSWKQARLTWNFNTMLRMSSVLARAYCSGMWFKAKNTAFFSTPSRHPLRSSRPGRGPGESVPGRVSNLYHASLYRRSLHSAYCRCVHRSWSWTISHLGTPAVDNEDTSFHKKNYSIQLHTFVEKGNILRGKNKMHPFDVRNNFVKPSSVRKPLVRRYPNKY